MNKIVPIGNGYVYEYSNYRIEKKSNTEINNERYEGLMRGESRTISEYKHVFDSCKVIKEMKE